MSRRLANHRAALAFLRLPPTEPELRLLHQVDPMISSAGYGVAAIPWGAVQRAAWEALRKAEVEL